MRGRLGADDIGVDHMIPVLLPEDDRRSPTVIAPAFDVCIPSHPEYSLGIGIGLHRGRRRCTSCWPISPLYPGVDHPHLKHGQPFGFPLVHRPLHHPCESRSIITEKSIGDRRPLPSSTDPFDVMLFACSSVRHPCSIQHRWISPVQRADLPVQMLLQCRLMGFEEACRTSHGEIHVREQS